ncbi:hypothetical protein CHS0354_000022 [Potamilus streckersoni]|uniref:Uncharacterized protein n=1 Tax=Potamilus streckersoni TaxID=2493646 RepID=A0AAE0TJ25_9BIVA|nr:hypothetical protein CHS0354_000022 [Potamilus streckersoni]
MVSLRISKASMKKNIHEIRTQSVGFVTFILQLNNIVGDILPVVNVLVTYFQCSPKGLKSTQKSQKAIKISKCLYSSGDTGGGSAGVRAAQGDTIRGGNTKMTVYKNFKLLCRKEVHELLHLVTSTLMTPLLSTSLESYYRDKMKVFK